MNTLIIAASFYLAAAPAKGPSQLTIEVKPNNCVVLVDGKKKGTGAKAIVLKGITPGRHVIRVTHKGDAHEEDVVVKSGEKKTWKWTFEDDGAAPPKKKPEGEKPEVETGEGDKPVDDGPPK
jgi:hypothetical protein